MSHSFPTKAEAARCSLCRSYLSVEPVWILSNYNPACGRCNVPKKYAKHRAVFFEEIAVNMSFPCRYDVFGCDALLPWGSVQSHETSCKFIPMKCPALCCIDEILFENILKHFQEKHPELIMDTNMFKVPCQAHDENSHVNRLFICENKIYLIQIGYYLKACYFNITSFEANSKFFYDLTISGRESTGQILVGGVEINSYQNRNHDCLKMKKLDFSALSDFLSDQAFFCTFKISDKKNLSEDPLNQKFLSELECPVYFDYMSPPIYLCTKGHSICGNCQTKMTLCPFCKMQLGDSRNFTLEKLSEHVRYPCKYIQNGCKFYGKTEELAVHEKVCRLPPKSPKRKSENSSLVKSFSLTRRIKSLFKLIIKIILWFFIIVMFIGIIIKK